MVAFHVLDKALPAMELGQLTLNGDFLIWWQVPAMVDFCRHADQLIRHGLQDDDPLTAEARIDSDLYIKRIRSLRAQFKDDLSITGGFKQAIIEAGLDATDSYWDPLQLRVVPSQTSHQARRIWALPPHRDNWGSNIAQQINWWAPIYPVAADRTIIFYPRFWNEPIANTSADWDFEVLKQLMSVGKGDTYPVLPVPTEKLSPQDGMPIVLQPGDMLAFSGQHLHGSIALDQTQARFSIESRTVSLSHLVSGLAAPNVDGRAPRVVPDWFEHMADRSAFSEPYRQLAGDVPPPVKIDASR
jgi:hypothetical protein